MMSIARFRAEALVEPEELAPPSPVIATLVGYDERVGALVKVEGDSSGGEPLPARSVIPLGPNLTFPAEVLVVFLGGDPRQPVILGLLQPPPLVDGGDGKSAASPPAVEAFLDGKRVVLSAQDEIVLRCGEASITLRRNGRVVLRGTYVETSSKGINRVKGGSVRIN